MTLCGASLRIALLCVVIALVGTDVSAPPSATGARPPSAGDRAMPASSVGAGAGRPDQDGVDPDRRVDRLGLRSSGPQREDRVVSEREGSELDVAVRGLEAGTPRGWSVGIYQESRVSGNWHIELAERDAGHFRSALRGDGDVFVEVFGAEVVPRIVGPLTGGSVVIETAAPRRTISGVVRCGSVPITGAVVRARALLPVRTQGPCARFTKSTSPVDGLSRIRIRMLRNSGDAIAGAVHAECRTSPRGEFELPNLGRLAYSVEIELPREFLFTTRRVAEVGADVMDIDVGGAATSVRFVDAQGTAVPGVQVVAEDPEAEPEQESSGAVASNDLGIARPRLGEGPSSLHAFPPAGREDLGDIVFSAAPEQPAVVVLPSRWSLEFRLTRLPEDALGSIEIRSQDAGAAPSVVAVIEPTLGARTSVPVNGRPIERKPFWSAFEGDGLVPVECVDPRAVVWIDPRQKPRRVAVPPPTPSRLRVSWAGSGADAWVQLLREDAQGVPVAKCYLGPRRRVEPGVSLAFRSLDPDARFTLWAAAGTAGHGLLRGLRATDCAEVVASPGFEWHGSVLLAPGEALQSARVGLLVGGIEVSSGVVSLANRTYTIRNAPPLGGAIVLDARIDGVWRSATRPAREGAWRDAVDFDVRR
jgi:hypothetical protein